METQNLPENVILVKLSASEPQISEELRELNETISQKSDCDVIVDFSYVEIINSSNISNLLLLRGFLEEHNHRLILYNVQTITKCIFVVAGLTSAFVFIDDMEDVLKAVQSTT
jgi:anti-anti-sigma regulatory factor